MDNIANEENINTEKIINLIKKNLKKEHFRSHNDIIKFLENKKIPLSQSRISYYLNKYNIHKNKLGYYEDFSANVRESLLKDILLKSNAHIYKPRIYGLNIDSTTKKNDLFFENKLRYVMNKSKKKTACLKNSKLSLSKKVIKQHVLPFRCVGNEYKHALT